MKGRNIVLLLGCIALLTGEASALILNTDDFFPADSKQVTIGGVKMEIGIDQVFNNITDKDSEHFYRFRIYNKNAFSVISPSLSKTFEVSLTKGEMTDIKFYSFNKTISTNSENFMVDWTETSLTSLVLPVSANTEYLLSFNTDNWVSGQYNLTFETTGALSAKFKLDPNVSGCGAFSTEGATYTMINNIASTSSTCITFGASNILLDCAGYSITGNQSVNAYGILANGYDNITIRNCLITGYRLAINFTSTNNSYIINTTIYNTTGINGANGNNGAPCTAGASATDRYGIWLSNSQYNTLANNTLINLTAGNGGFGGLRITTAGAGCAGGNGGIEYGIYLASNSKSNTITNTTITSLTGGNGGFGGNGLLTGAGGAGGAGSAAYAIYTAGTGSINNSIDVAISLLTGGKGNYGGDTGLTSIRAGGKGGAGGYAEGVHFLSANNTFTGSVYNLTGGDGGTGGAGLGTNLGGAGGVGGSAYAAYISATNGNETISNATLANLTGGDGGKGGVCVAGTGGDGGAGGEGRGAHIASRYGTFNNCSLMNITGGIGGQGGSGLSDGTAGANETGEGIRFQGTSATDHNIMNTIISQITTSDIISHTSAKNNVLLNCSFNESKVGWGTCSPCNLTVKWYARINVTNSIGTPQASDVLVKDNLSYTVLNTTASLTLWFIVSDYITSKNGATLTNTTFNNYTINVSCVGYIQNSTSFNFSYQDATVNLTLYISQFTYIPIYHTLTYYASYTSLTLEVISTQLSGIIGTNFSCFKPSGIYYVVQGVAVGNNYTKSVILDQTGLWNCSGILYNNVNYEVNSTSFTVTCPVVLNKNSSFFCYRDLNVFTEILNRYYGVGDEIVIWVNISDQKKSNEVYAFGSDNTTQLFQYLYSKDLWFTYFTIKQKQDIVQVQSYYDGALTGIGEVTITINPLPIPRGVIEQILSNLPVFVWIIIGVIVLYIVIRFLIAIFLFWLGRKIIKKP
jgi:hypothetical protein